LAKYPLWRIAVYRLLRAYKNEATQKYGRGTPSNAPKLIWKPDLKVYRLANGRMKTIGGAFVPIESVKYVTEEGLPLTEEKIYVTVHDLFEAIHLVVEEVEEIKRRSDIEPLTDYTTVLLSKISGKELQLREKATKIGFEVYNREHLKRDQLIDALVKNVTRGALARLKAYYFTRITDMVRQRGLDKLRDDQVFWEEIKLMQITREIVHNLRERYELRPRDLTYA